MGCGASKVDDLPLVMRCRERKRLIKSAVDYRYDLSASHLAYFHSLREVGYVLSRFVDEQLVIPSPPASSSSSPVLTLPSNHDSESELSVSLDGHIHIHDLHDVNDNDNDNNDDDDDGGGGGFDNKPPLSSDLNRPHGYNGNNTNEPYQPPWGEPYAAAFPYQPPWGPNQTSWGEYDGGPYGMDPSASQYQPPWGAYQANFDSNPNPNSNRYAFYMKKPALASHTVIHQEEARGFQETSQWVDPYASAYGYGFSYGGAPPPSQEPEKPKSPPPPPPPMESDYFNFFNAYDNEYHGYGYGYGYETRGSSPDTSEVREREGIPDLEEETETESHNEEVVKMKTRSAKRNLGEGKEDIEGSSWKETSSSTEGSSRRTPPGKSESTSHSVPLENKEGAHSVNTEVDKHSSETVVSQITEVGHEEGKKGVSFDKDEGSAQELEIESSNLSSLTTLSPHGSRDLHEVVNEIKDEFENAFTHGKEVALMLEAGKLPYQPKYAVLKVILSKILYPLAPSLASSDHPIQSVRASSRVTKLPRAYDEDAVLDVSPINLSSTLEKLYVWEKKLYKEVKVIGLVLG